MSGLEGLGLPGPDYLREALTNCTDPLRAIDEFQLENGILLPSLRPMLPLLDLHMVPRLEFHQSVLEELRDHLVQRAEHLGKHDQPRLRELLLKCFPVVHVPQLRPVALAVMKHLERIDGDILAEVISDKALYNESDTAVKRQIWENNQTLFGEEVSPLLSQYLRDKEATLFGIDADGNMIMETDISPPAAAPAPGFSGSMGAFFNITPKSRRQGDIVQKLMHRIGKNVRLYEMVLAFLKTLFCRTRTIHYCTLRSELLMALHDAEINEITQVDPCHKFTWCLDACIRERLVDIKRSKELQGHLDNARKSQEQTLADIAMTLADPYAINFLAAAILKVLQLVIANESLPRENTVLLLLLRMLALGLHAWDVFDGQVSREPRLDPMLVTKFLPALMSLMVDDQVRALNAKLPPDDREYAITIIEHAGPTPDTYQAFIQENNVASILAIYYTLHTAKQKDRLALMRVLGLLGNCDNFKLYEDLFLHALVALLIPMADEFSTEDFCTVVFDEFFFPNISRENVLRHLLRLLWHVWPKMPPTRLNLLMKAITPAVQHAQGIHRLHQQLTEQIERQEPKKTEATAQTPMDSSLMGVPTPAPL